MERMIILFLVLSSKVLAQIELKTNFVLENDSIYLGQSIDYAIEVENFKDSTIWIHSYFVDKGAKIYVTHGSNSILLKNSFKTTEWGSDWPEPEFYYEIPSKSKIAIQRHYYPIFDENNNAFKLIKKNTFRLNFEFHTVYQLPSENQKKLCLKSIGKDVTWVYFDDGLYKMYDENLWAKSYDTRVNKKVYIKPFKDIDKKAYEWLVQEGIFEYLFEGYNKSLDYSILEKFLQKFPHSIFTLKCKEKIADYFWANNNNEKAKNIFREIISSNNYDIYRVNERAAYKLKEIEGIEYREKQKQN